MEPQKKPLDQYLLGELQEVLDFLSEKCYSAKKEEEIKKWRKAYQAVAIHYNKRAGSKVYRINL